MLLKTVSDYYEHPERKPSIPFPTYEKYLATPLPAPNPASVAYSQAASCIPTFFRSFTKDEHAWFLEETQRATHRVDFRISGRRMRALQRAVSTEAGEKVSQGDALVSLFWKAINDVYPIHERCDSLMNIVQVCDIRPRNANLMLIKK
jgi:xanthine/CO dehydrogenase XdhC/CoxF family maturation factor